VRHFIIIILGLALYGCSSAKEQAQSCFSSFPRTFAEGSSCHVLMETYANLTDKEELEVAKKSGLDTFFSFMDKVSLRTQRLRTNFEAMQDGCGVLITTSLLNEYQYFQQANPKRSKEAPHYGGAVYKASKHAICRFSSSEIPTILTSSAILLRPKMDDKHLLAALSEHYQAMAGERVDIASCPVTFISVFLNASVVKSSRLGKVITQKVRSCIADEPDPEKRKVIITMLDNVRDENLTSP
jgi:hypothetical protein